MELKKNKNMSTVELSIMLRDGFFLTSSNARSIAERLGTPFYGNFFKMILNSDDCRGRKRWARILGDGIK